ncbi:hypothetical protein [Companilactobacillus hulinensis]|uniref:hypothetical protein n=1 Tax=Companilactobacillus hulinensis TaxID=2486007 RepID=UPI000F79D4CC|nr:hypothetical protein [Companilactobacillus hulinensis]
MFKTLKKYYRDYWGVHIIRLEFHSPMSFDPRMYPQLMRMGTWNRNEERTACLLLATKSSNYKEDVLIDTLTNAGIESNEYDIRR